MFVILAKNLKTRWRSSVLLTSAQIQGLGLLKVTGSEAMHLEVLHPLAVHGVYLTENHHQDAQAWRLSNL